MIIVTSRNYKGKRFVVQEGSWSNGGKYLMVYDQETYMIVGYFDCDDRSTAVEVCDYCNSLNSDILYCMDEIGLLKEAVDKSNMDLVREKVELGNLLNRERGLRSVELRHYKEVLRTLLEVYGDGPERSVLLEFKGLVDW